MPEPTLSVAFPNYNDAKFLPQALDAMLGQSLPPYEIVIIDDCSTDNSVEVIEAYARKHPCIKLVRNEQNLGPARSLQKLLEIVSGEFLNFAAADDMVLPGFFEKSVRMLERYPQAGFCSALSMRMSREGKLTVPLKMRKALKAPGYMPPEKIFSLFRRRNDLWVAGNTAIHRTRLLKEAGGIRPELGYFCDGFAYVVSALRNGACFIPEHLGSRRDAASSISIEGTTDPDILLKMSRQVAQLMREELGDLFPADFVKVWETRQICTAARLEWGKYRAGQNEAVSKNLVPLLEKSGRPPRLFLHCLQGLSKAQTLAVAAYLFFRFGIHRQWLGSGK